MGIEHLNGQQLLAWVVGRKTPDLSTVGGGTPNQKCQTSLLRYIADSASYRLELSDRFDQQEADGLQTIGGVSEQGTSSHAEIWEQWAAVALKVGYLTDSGLEARALRWWRRYLWLALQGRTSKGACFLPGYRSLWDDKSPMPRSDYRDVTVRLLLGEIRKSPWRNLAPDTLGAWVLADLIGKGILEVPLEPLEPKLISPMKKFGTGETFFLQLTDPTHGVDVLPAVYVRDGSFVSTQQPADPPVVNPGLQAALAGFVPKWIAIGAPEPGPEKPWWRRFLEWL